MYYIHVNKNTILKNKKRGETTPAVRYQKGKYGESIYCNRLKFVEGEIIYKPTGEPLLPCGARLVIQTEIEPIVLE